MWKTSKWTLQAVQFLSPRALKASLSSGPMEITLMVVHTSTTNTHGDKRNGRKLPKSCTGPT